MRKNFLIISGLIILFTALLFSSTQVQAAFFQSLGGLPGISDYSVAGGASADGSTVVGYGSSASGVEAFRWDSSGGMVGLGKLPGSGGYSVALGVSADGSIVVGYGSSVSSVEAFRWDSSGGMVGLGGLPGGNFESHAFGVSADGSIVVGSGSSASGVEAFRWDSSGDIVGLGDLPGGNFESHALGVSADGSTIVGYGQTVSGTGTSEAFRWTSSGGMVGLGDLPGGNFASIAYGVSADGSTAVGRGTSEFGIEAFIWDKTHGMLKLNYVLTQVLGLGLNGNGLASATGISADGQTIVGYGHNSYGFTEAWIANISFEPTGDFDIDDDVEGSDLYDFIIAFSNGTYPGADTNEDGEIDSDDVARFAYEFGRIRSSKI